MACSCAWLLDIAQVYSMLSSYLTFIFPVILPHFYLTCHLTLLLSCLSSYLTFIVPVILPHFYLTCHLTSLLSCLSSYLTFIVPVILPHFYLTCHLTSLLSYLSSYLTFIFTWLLQVALGSPETAKRFSMKSGQQQYIDNLIRLFPQEEDAIKKYEKHILVSTSCGCEYSSVYCDLVLLQLCDHFHISKWRKWVCSQQTSYR